MDLSVKKNWMNGETSCSETIRDDSYEHKAGQRQGLQKNDIMMGERSYWQPYTGGKYGSFAVEGVETQPEKRARRKNRREQEYGYGVKAPMRHQYEQVTRNNAYAARTGSAA
jgi:hypothetical protein